MEGTTFTLTMFSLCFVIVLTTLDGVHGGSNGKHLRLHHHLTHRHIHKSALFVSSFSPPSSTSSSSSSLPSIHTHRLTSNQLTTCASASSTTDDKSIFLNSLDTTDSLNVATKQRTNLLQQLIDNKIYVASNEWNNEKQNLSSSSLSSKSLEKPGLSETFNLVSKGNWKVIYAPHMTTIAALFGGNFDVQYILYDNAIMESHAKYDFPIIGKGFLSVSGTYSSVNETISRVDFDKAWVKPIISMFSNEEEKEGKRQEEEVPYKTLDDVPPGIIKDIINTVGKTFFIEQFSVFPISFLDENLIVFDFPLLGTRICALKQ